MRISICQEVFGCIMCTYDIIYVRTMHLIDEVYMKLRVLEILKEKGKTKYWLYMQMGLSYQNFNNMAEYGSASIKKY